MPSEDRSLTPYYGFTHPAAPGPQLRQASHPTLPSSQQLGRPLLSHLWNPFLPYLHHQSPTLTVLDHEAYLFADCLHYYNEIMRPLLVGCLIPNQPREFRTEEWINTPPLMKHATVYALSTHRMARGEDFPELKTQRLVHRGKTVVLLRQALEMLQGSQWAAFVMIVQFLGGEIATSSVSGWQTHFEAAWRMLESIGGGTGRVGDGVEYCWNLCEEPQLACVYLVQVEVFSATTAPVWVMGRGREREVVRVLGRKDLGDMEDRFVASMCACPLEIVRTLAEINGLRAELYALQRTPDRGEGFAVDGESEVSTRLWNILTRLLSFKATNWVERTLMRHDAQVVHAETAGGFDRQAMTESWTRLADCYRSATVIYLLRACASSHLSTALPEGCRAFMEDSEEVLNEHQHILSMSLAYLLRGLGFRQTDIRGPILWRFIYWPVFIEAYEFTGWSPKAADSCATAEVDGRLDRMRLLGRQTGAMCMSDAAELLKKVARERKGKQAWHWDDAFPQRVLLSV
ncbi:uncharacterized protein AB675_11439 [Cyphellophora attinorum]|uniref:Transcription factor domain-containing protein n=1 Tax=Cyphellophora attinorum TaxID=1664694 RepID=A0A0N1H9B8_9EURO|nr:uncharacterized protein AB675_11439 [Phialophora attinorum]KPI40120.1 hypothetical protein AB675_11439 [Phialophora attinorum]